MNRFTVIAVLLVTFGFASAQAQFVSDVSKRGTVAAPFLNISQGARATAMGSSFTAIADDPTAIFWNVAGIARLEQNGVVVDHTEYFADLGYNFVAAAVHMGSLGTLGLSIIASDYGEMDVTTIDEPMGTGQTFGVTDFAVSLAYAVNLTDNFSIGFNPKVVYQGIWDMSATTFAIDMGILYNTPFEGFVLGMSLTNFSPDKMQMNGTNSVVLHDPDETTSGNNNRIPAELSTGEWDMPMGFKIGVSWHPIETDMHDLILSVDAAHPNNDYEYANVGLEYTIMELVSLRGGYKNLFLDNAEETYTFGGGIQRRIVGNMGLHFDYAYMAFGRLGDVHKVSFGIDF